MPHWFLSLLFLNTNERLPIRAPDPILIFNFLSLLSMDWKTVYSQDFEIWRLWLFWVLMSPSGFVRSLRNSKRVLHCSWFVLRKSFFEFWDLGSKLGIGFFSFDGKIEDCGKILKLSVVSLFFTIFDCLSLLRKWQTHWGFSVDSCWDM